MVTDVLEIKPYSPAYALGGVMVTTLHRLFASKVQNKRTCMDPFEV